MHVIVRDQDLERMARLIVTRVAPDELSLYPAASRAFLANPAAMIGESNARDEVLALGGMTDIAMLTPYILAVSHVVLGFIGTDIVEPLVKEGAGAFRQKIKAIFKHPDPPSQATSLPSEFTQEQLAQVREVALEKARMMHLPKEKAELIADAAVGSLALKAHS